MDKVKFITLENDEDIVISLSFEEGTEFGIDGFIIQRNAGLEFILSPEEKGACLTWDDDDDIRVLLDKVIIERSEISLETKGKYCKYQFDLSGISDAEYKKLVEHFHLINFDKSINIKIC